MTSSLEDAIAVVVVTHESADTIDDCLMRLRLAHGVDQIRVVDNASTDATMDIVQRHALHDARVRFIANPDNPGFAVGCNQGARDAAARRRDPVFAQMLRAPGRASKLGVPPDDTRALQPVDAVSGALMLMSRPLFDRLDGLDEGYRLHAEDMDLCRRARQAGAVVAVANDIRVLHIRGVSSRARPVFVEWHKHRGLWRYFRKFEAAQRGLVTRLGVFGAVWLHFGAVLARLLLPRR